MLMLSFEIGRLILALASLGLGLLVWTRAHSLKVWMLSLGGTEFGHYFAVVPLAVLLTGSWSLLSGAVSVVALSALVVLLAPAFWARRISAGLPAALEKAFGRTAPSFRFSWRRLFFGRAIPPVSFETLIYDEAHGLRLNFYRSLSKKPPCVIVLHTGGWGNGAPEEFLKFNDHIAREGYAVAALQYRLAPRWKWPATYEDVRQAVTYLRERAVELGIDASRFVLLGRSAGGQIAEAAAYLGNDPAIRGCIAFYAPTDMTFSYRLGFENDILESPKLLRNYLGGSPDEVPAIYREASPRLNVHPNVPPTLLLHGRRDSLVWYRQSKRLANALKKVNAPHYYLEFPWATHAFDYNHHGPAGQLAKYAIDYFLDLVTQPTSIDPEADQQQKGKDRA